MVTLPVVLLIFISKLSSYRNGNLGDTALAFESNIDGGVKDGRDLKEMTETQVNDLTVRDLKPMNDNLEQEEKQHQQQRKCQQEKERGVVRSASKGSSPNEEEEVSTESKILRDAEPKEGITKENGPMPLYSLVKNVCEDGYIMDQNGVCQKAVVLRNGKEFDSEREKRFIHSDQLTGQRHGKPFFEHFNKPFPYRKLLEKFKSDERFDCGKIYPGLVSDGVGGCRISTPKKVVAAGLPFPV
ncbi:hypothetical protein RUM44_007828 [Polyplax serrata]|uniref:Uncharacterized protein n=1 Tax=Polyplax serrata TaxID=468196 RepID=A0ABR1B7A1_POLSC